MKVIPYQWKSPRRRKAVEEIEVVDADVSTIRVEEEQDIADAEEVVHRMEVDAKEIKEEVNINSKSEELVFQF